MMRGSLGGSRIYSSKLNETCLIFQHSNGSKFGVLKIGLALVMENLYFKVLMLIQEELLSAPKLLGLS
jgi:IS4 transposase